jgi:hypothetical protein
MDRMNIFFSNQHSAIPPTPGPALQEAGKKGNWWLSGGSATQKLPPPFVPGLREKDKKDGFQTFSSIENFRSKFFVTVIR